MGAAQRRVESVLDRWQAETCINFQLPFAPRPANAIFAAVRKAVRKELHLLMKDAELAEALDVSPTQAKAWLQRLVDEGVIENRKKPAGYVVRQSTLFE